MSFHCFQWHGLYLHPQLALEGTGVLAAVSSSDSLLNGSVSTGAWKRLDREIALLQPVNARVVVTS